MAGHEADRLCTASAFTPPVCLYGMQRHITPHFFIYLLLNIIFLLFPILFLLFLRWYYDGILYLQLPGLWIWFHVYSLKQYSVEECHMMERPRNPIVPTCRSMFLVKICLVMNTILISGGTIQTSGTLHESSVS